MPGVLKAAKAPSFSEQQSEAYWKSLATAAKDVPAEPGVHIPPQAAWSPPVAVNADPAPTRRKLEAAHVFTDHMVLIDWEKEKGFINPRVVPYAKLDMDPEHDSSLRSSNF